VRIMLVAGCEDMQIIKIVIIKGILYRWVSLQCCAHNGPYLFLHRKVFELFTRNNKITIRYDSHSKELILKKSTVILSGNASREVSCGYTKSN
jgi:hypothetical protein